MTQTVLENLQTERKARIEALGYDYQAQPKAYLDSCNLCQKEQFVIITHEDRYGYPAKAMACMHCGLIFLNPLMDKEAYGAFYENTYRPLVSAFHGRLINADTIQDEQKVYAERLAEFMEPFVLGQGHHPTLLDIGGSTGVVAHEIVRRFGYQATVLDPAPPELAKAQALGLNTHVGFLEDLDPQDMQFDAILLCQTIDHLLDVSGSLAKIKQLLSPEGLFFVDILDFRAVSIRTRSIAESIKIDHPYYLTEPTTEAYLARAGFEVVRKNYSQDTWHIGYLCKHATPNPTALPSRESVETSLREIREIQNPPR